MELELIKRSILEIRGKKVMLDMDLATIYEVETRVLKQAVRRNLDRFPDDFMFELTIEEMNNLVSQIVIPTLNHFGGAKPFAFTEQGVAMLSSVLKSKKAIQMNIAIMRAFVLMRQFALTYQELSEQLKDLENKHNHKFDDIEQVLKYLIQKDKKQNHQFERKQVGYKK
ncbi:MAG: ORF6N domain-containing protein [Flavobacteriales bacterium]|nr:ORF6N domain-containing protein [Crocinitomicaceae bacterium]NBX79783.1 ORF6N domain-containing protein [Flavobacteriales bacterium]NCA19758.1 ORF6N domain-containing protein [Crocinitomicaceae bacterium]